MHDHLRVQLRIATGRRAEPSAGLLDSQSVKMTEQRGERGYDAGKKIKGRKRHLLVDTMGLLLVTVVHRASLPDRDGAKLVLDQARRGFPHHQRIWADGWYAGKLLHWVEQTCPWVLEIIKRTVGRQGFHVRPHLWIVERTDRAG